MATDSETFTRAGTAIYVELEHTDLSRDPAEAELEAEGWRWGKCFSEVVPEGEYGHVHLDELEPLSRELFERARAAGWPPRSVLERPGPRRAHYLPGAPLVPAKFFSEELEERALATLVEERAKGRPGLRRVLHRLRPGRRGEPSAPL
jgi:hypothetical protein